MRLVFYNPHIHDFLGEPIQFHLLKRRALKKYETLLFESIKKYGKANVYIDYTFSSLLPFNLFNHLPKTFKKYIVDYEFNMWVKYSGLGGNIKIIDRKEIQQDDILFFFSHKISLGDFRERYKSIELFKTKIVHLSHYFVKTSEKSRNLQKLTNLVFIGDSDISQNDYFKYFFSWYSNEIIVLPFIINDRFKIIKPFEERSPKVIATGTFHNLLKEYPQSYYTDFMAFFKTTNYHPIRMEIYDKQESLKEIIKSYISPFRPYEKIYFGKLFNLFNIKQKQYFSFDIVDAYNSYQFAIVGEELSGFPAVGIFEAMASGCIPFIQPQYYVGLGLEENVHYISYDGDLTNLKLLINNLNSDKLLTIFILDNIKKYIENIQSFEVYKILETKILDLNNV